MTPEKQNNFILEISSYDNDNDTPCEVSNCNDSAQIKVNDKILCLDCFYGISETASTSWQSKYNAWESIEFTHLANDVNIKKWHWLYNVDTIGLFMCPYCTRLAMVSYSNIVFECCCGYENNINELNNLHNDSEYTQERQRIYPQVFKN